MRDNTAPWWEAEPDARELEIEAERETEQRWQERYRRWLLPFVPGMRVYEPASALAHKNRGVVVRLCPKNGCVRVQRDCDPDGKVEPIRADYLRPERARGRGNMAAQ